MNKNMTEKVKEKDLVFTPMGCPNNCAYCRENNLVCVYKSQAYKEKSNK